MKLPLEQAKERCDCLLSKLGIISAVFNTLNSTVTLDATVCWRFLQVEAHWVSPVFEYGNGALSVVPVDL